MSAEVTEKPVDTKENGNDLEEKGSRSEAKEVSNAETSEVSKEPAKEEATDAAKEPVNIDALDRMPNTGHLVEVNGKILHYERVGTGKIPVLLMPGLMGSSRSDFPEQLGTSIDPTK